MTAIFAGTFDPFTIGHYDIVVRALKIFGNVTVAVASDTGKNCASIADRTAIARASVKGLCGVSVVNFDGLLTEFAKRFEDPVFVRAVRNEKDFDYERDLDAVYKSLGNVDSVYFMCSPTLSHVSSTVLRSLSSIGANTDGYAVESAQPLIKSIYGKSKKEQDNE